VTGIEWVPMVDSALVALGAAAGAGAWAQARSGIVALFRRHARDTTAIEEQLTADRDRLARGDAATVDAWRARLTELLQERPEAVAELRDWESRQTQQNVQHITASAPNATAQGVMFGTIVNHHAPPAPQ
jgi:hypothetical protein